MLTGVLCYAVKVGKAGSKAGRNADIEKLKADFLSDVRKATGKEDALELGTTHSSLGKVCGTLPQCVATTYLGLGHVQVHTAKKEKWARATTVRCCCAPRWQFLIAVWRGLCSRFPAAVHGLLCCLSSACISVVGSLQLFNADQVATSLKRVVTCCQSGLVASTAAISCRVASKY